MQVQADRDYLQEYVQKQFPPKKSKAKCSPSIRQRTSTGLTAVLATKLNKIPKYLKARIHDIQKAW